LERWPPDLRRRFGLGNPSPILVCNSRLGQIERVPLACGSSPWALTVACRWSRASDSMTPLPTNCSDLIREQYDYCCYGNAYRSCIPADKQERYGYPARNRSDECTYDKRFTDRNRDLGPEDILQAKILAQSSRCIGGITT
jgi:hypothetical protein